MKNNAEFIGRRSQIPNRSLKIFPLQFHWQSIQAHRAVIADREGEMLAGVVARCYYATD